MRVSVAFLVVVGSVLLAAACQRTDQSAGARCERVAETLASFEVGEKANAEQRRSAAARHRAACESTKVTADEATCLFKATDTWAARACLPRMFPAKLNDGSCATVAARMRAAVIAEAGSGELTQQRLDSIIAIVQKACEEDGWPASITQCVMNTQPGDMAAFQVCYNQLPKPLQDSLARRQAQAQPQ